MAQKRRFNEGRYILTAYLFLLRYPLILLTVALLIRAVINQDLDQLLHAGVAAVVTLVLIFVFFMKSSQVSCRLCRATFLRNLKCTKKSHVRNLFGSHRLPVAFALVTRQKKIRCPYCGEKHHYFD